MGELLAVSFGRNGTKSLGRPKQVGTTRSRDRKRNTIKMAWWNFLSVCIMNGKVSEKNLFIDGISHKRKILYEFVLRTVFTNGLLC